MKKDFVISFLILTTLMFLSCYEKKQKTTSQQVGTVVAKVGNSTLTLEQLNKLLPEQYMSKITSADKRNAIEKWIETEIIYQEALKENLNQDEDVKYRLKEMEKQFLADELRIRFMQKLPKISLEEAKNYYESHKEQFKREYAEVKFSHLFYSKYEDAYTALTKLQNGVDFAELIKANASDSTSAFPSGDYSYLTEYELGNEIPEIWRVANEIPINTYSYIIKTKYGYHIIKVIDRQPKDSIRDFSLVKDEIVSRISMEKQQIAFQKWIDELKANTPIQTMYELLEK